MLWKKESTPKNALYVDLFKSQGSIDQMLREYKTQSELCYTFGKDNTEALERREKGNKKFHDQDLFAAMKFYNISLCAAENDSEMVGLAYANRSTCFLRMNMFKNCLADIELAMQHNYPANMMHKLVKRRATCMDLMKKQEDLSDMVDPSLDFDANDKFPCLGNVIEVQKSDEKRCIVATKDIEVGKTVMVEPIYFGEAFSDKSITCNICLRMCLTLKPCNKCTYALFCSKCEKNDLHGTECGILPHVLPHGIYSDDRATIRMMAMRSILLAKLAFSNADQLIDFVEKMRTNPVQELPEKLTDSQLKYRSFFEMINNPKDQMDKQLIYLIYRTLLAKQDVAVFFKTSAHRRFLMHLIGHHLTIIQYNATSLNGTFTLALTNDQRALINDQSIAKYLGIIGSYFNHSCAPNVLIIPKNGFLTCIVIRPIRKNEQLLRSYVDFEGVPREQRQQSLMRYNIQCQCDRCELDSEMSNHRMKFDSKFVFMQSVSCEAILEQTIQGAMLKIKCFELLQRYGRVWCNEVEFIIMTLLRLLARKLEVKSLGNTSSFETTSGEIGACVFGNAERK